ncbi:MAG: hypothetical protein IJ141_08505 [Lachnospiraceae bacterium]|nr:hypothetical protein [Lachnospiraceae bacterium]
MSWIDVFLDVCMAFCCILLVVFAYYPRIKGIKLIYLYAVIWVLFLFVDFLLYLKPDNFYLRYFYGIIGFLIEIFIYYLCSYFCYGNIYKNIVWFMNLNILSNVLVNVISMLNPKTGKVLLDSNLLRTGNGSAPGVMYFVIMLIISYFISIFLFRRITRRNTTDTYVIYKIIIFAYFIYGGISIFFRAYTPNEKKSVKSYIIIPHLIFLIVIFYIMFYMYNVNMRKQFEKELLTAVTAESHMSGRYLEAYRDNISLNKIKKEYESYTDDIINKSKDNEALLKYAKSIEENRSSFSCNPLTGSLMIDSLFSELESKVKEKNGVCELTIGGNCEKLLDENEKILSYIIKSVSDISEKIKEKTYVVISLRNVNDKMFVSIDMQCTSDIHNEKTISRLITYIKAERRNCRCYYDKESNKANISVLI